jgi:carboxypeptidase T
MEGMKMQFKWTLVPLALLALLPWHSARSIDSSQYWLKVRARDKFERSVVADTGAAIEVVRDDYVMAIANFEEKAQLEKLGWVESASDLVSAMDFPQQDREFHNYQETVEALENLVQEFPWLMRMESIGKTVQGRDIWSLVISKDIGQSSNKPAVLFLGGHHAREHLSVEVPLRFVQWLMNEYNNGNPRAVRYVETREIHLIPMVNPDGLEYDVEGGRYKYWRKNRSRNSNGTFGVDLNRNYGYQWGTGGSSTNPNSETFMGTAPFSEPETQAIKKYIETHTNISILLSFHTFSELVLYPWGHSHNPIAEARDKAVHETMARKMASWNGYTPEQSSDLYIASGDLTDWSYGAQKVISFTFELDPNSNSGQGGFYPGQGVIQPVLQKNIEPCLYLLEYADNPYRVLDPAGAF